MDTPPFEHLRGFFDRVKNAGFFERLFSWKRIAAAGYDAYAEFSNLQAALTEAAARQRELAHNLEHQAGESARLAQDLSAERGQVLALNGRLSEREQAVAQLTEAQRNSEDEILRLKGEMVVLASRNEDLQQRIAKRENEAGGLVAAEKKNRETMEKLNNEIVTIGVKNDNLNSQIVSLKQELTQYRQIEEDRTREHDQRITALNSLKDQLDKDRIKIEEDRANEIRAKFSEIEQTWRKHEEIVEQSLRAICQRHTIEYCDKEKFPVSGKKPDNALLIADQYVIFDAKSPKNSEELGNFPQYIRTQAEALKKYVRDETVKKDIFLVVPSNTLEYLDDVHLDMADYQVYVITHDSLEPIVLALRKIEDYQFVDQLSPEDREKICHVIGKFAHATKRRMQIDTYFFNEFLGLLKSCESLPDDILQSVVNFEKAEKMNPPMEKRKKQIPIKDLEHDVKVITKEAEAREIDVSAVTREKIENMPLHKFLE